ncbi:MAG: hypothetical protein RR034_04590 [Bacteroidales bacterium]
MLLTDALTGKNLLKYHVKQESNSSYQQGIETLQNSGFHIIGIVCDGHKELIQSFTNIPVQMCQFHQCAIIRRYLTKRLKIQASIELMQIVD